VDAPSELPNFDHIPTYVPHRQRRSVAPAFLGVAGVFLVVGVLALVDHHSPTTTTSALASHVASSIDDLPANSRSAARSTIELVATIDGHLSTAAAMVLPPGNVAVTTTPLPPSASITGTSLTHDRIAVTWLGRDRHLGLTIVRLDRTEPVSDTSSLPASTRVTALAPVFDPTRKSVSYNWSTTTLGDPQRVSVDGVVSYLATSSAGDLHGFSDTVAVDDDGRVVAVLNARGQWSPRSTSPRSPTCGTRPVGATVASASPASTPKAVASLS
jgi:hypothetical protein